ncbi:MAG: hypothetical protein GTO02_15535 [Candidatus Dadabacteria bacterium]|nr:hypothetical protein [Candidatus Dadabacteria bacterium]
MSSKIQQIIKEIKSTQTDKDTLSKKQTNLFWKESALLHKLKEEIFSNPNETKKWKTFLEELSIPLDTADFKVSIYKKWVQDLGFSLTELKGIHTKKLHTAVHFIKSKKDAKRVLVKARVRSLNAREFTTWLKHQFKKTKPHPY